MRLGIFSLCTLFGPQAVLGGGSGYSYVNPLIGTISGGHVFPGASLPFGMAKAVADVKGENQGGYGSDRSEIKGFSHMHDSGTGGATSLGNFPLFPLNCPGDDLEQCIHIRAVKRIDDSAEAYPGYFAITLDSGIKAEMTVSNHTALYRFTFLETENSPTRNPNPVIVTELTDLPGSERNTELSYNTTTGRITGSGTFTPSFGTGHYRLSFCVDYAGAAVRDAGAFADGTLGFYNGSGMFSYPFRPRGAFTRFDFSSSENAILARVGLSFKGTEQACRNAAREIPNFDFGDTLATAQQAWREKLEVVSVSDDQGVSRDLKAVFWSGIYRSFLSPQDYTGENPLWNSMEPYYDSFYCIWDSFRAQHPLLTILDPRAQTLMVRSLIDTYAHEGYLPDCRMSLCKGWTQGGSNADVVLADAYVKGLKEGIDWSAGYEAVLKDAEEEPERWSWEGRGGLVSWKTKGYIPIHDNDTLGYGTLTRSISRTVEYAYNDFSVAQIAKGLNKTADYRKYMKRSENWKNLLKVNQSTAINGNSVGFDGVLQPKHSNGSWAHQDPVLCSPLLEPNSCFLSWDGHETYEGSCWLYTFFVPGDIASLIEALGGRDSFIKRLDFFHESGLLEMGDEQGFLTPFLYHYAGRPGLSAKRAHTYIPRQFNNTLGGIPGNDDSGAMGSFAALTMLGLFPNAGQNVYLILPPFFREVSIRNPQTGNVATIRTVNFDPEYEAIYIQSASLDGQPYMRNWIDHAFFLDGGLLELVLSREESDWGTRDEDCPPSLSTTGPNGGTWDSSGPVRSLRLPGYDGIFGPSPKWEPIRLLFASLVLLCIATPIAVYRELRRPPSIDPNT
ncbi:alpha-1,2-mannosidase-like protein [Rhizodiscina lignyota]|uniref:Alpha-1,2-mannosidase-like protein n=1 Tax=Rhizodiscina lignyota TaxID=1504668 RepID=A0A9P4M695_9PEZI|nr:alpha-1,2-mannosidase-like protein [Rhizodiscina lignyota]